MSAQPVSKGHYANLFCLMRPSSRDELLKAMNDPQTADLVFMALSEYLNMWGRSDYVDDTDVPKVGFFIGMAAPAAFKVKLLKKAEASKLWNKNETWKLFMEAYNEALSRQSAPPPPTAASPNP